jgi:hypothetical protein
MKHRVLAFVLCVIAAVVVRLSFTATGQAVSAVPREERPEVAMAPSAVERAAAFGVSPAVRDLPLAEISSDKLKFHKHVLPVRRLPQAQNAVLTGTPDGALQVSDPQPAAMPGPTLSFDGLSNHDDTLVGIDPVPPDPNGDVGPNHYVQTVNILVRVFDKSGQPLTSPFPMSSLFAPIGGICAAIDSGDPIVLYDALADRWLLSQLNFVDEFSPPYHQCLAISQTADPTGAYFLYDFIMPGANLNDYPKFGVWPDGYYMTDNQFLFGQQFNGAGVFAFDRLRMLAGDPNAAYIYFDLEFFDPTIGGMLPSDLDGPPPPVGRPNTLAYFTATAFGDPQNGLRLFDFHADFAAPFNSTFTERPESPVSVPAFDPTVPDPFGNVVPQNPPGPPLESLTDRLMHRLQYRNRGTSESLVTNHTVTVAQTPYRGGIRYYALNRRARA